MAINDFDILNFQVFGGLFNQVCINTYNYQAIVNGTGQGYPIVMDTFISEVLAPIQEFQSQDFQYNEIILQNLTNGDDVYFRSYLGNGQMEVDSSASFIAFGFTLRGNTKVTRAGSRRIAGVPQTGVDQGVLTMDNSAVQDFEAIMTHQVVAGSSGNDVTCIPVIVGTTPEGNYDLTRVQGITSAALNLNITTQNTRKIGRGV